MDASTLKIVQKINEYTERICWINPTYIAGDRMFEVIFGERLIKTFDESEEKEMRFFLRGILASKINNL